MKEDAKKERRNWLFWLIMIILLGVIAFSLYQIGKILLEYSEGTQTYNSISALARPDLEQPDRIDFEKLAEQNADIRAWLYAEDTPIDYPVVQGRDNDYYLYRMFNGEWNGKGTLFIDYRCEKPFKDFCTVIYGHRMKDGSMFHCLEDYADLEFLKAHPTMDLMTPEKNYGLELFAVETIPAVSELYAFQFDNDEEKQAYLDQVRANSVVDPGVTVTTGDTIVMLSTCTSALDENRLVVFGRLIDPKN